jgi:hypothetical protein
MLGYGCIIPIHSVTMLGYGCIIPRQRDVHLDTFLKFCHNRYLIAVDDWLGTDTCVITWPLSSITQTRHKTNKKANATYRERVDEDGDEEKEEQEDENADDDPLVVAPDDELEGLPGGGKPQE